jgi:hypothetical protein
VAEVLAKIVDMVPTLRIVMEHITTKQGVDFVTQARDGLPRSRSRPAAPPHGSNPCAVPPALG